jgi:CHAT domain-containing protein/tetratricopeptide (TPR) repeat protein
VASEEDTELYWQGIAQARDSEELRVAITTDLAVARRALDQLFDLLRTLEPLVASAAVDRIRRLGLQMAEATGSQAAGARLRSRLHQMVAMEALGQGEKERAAQEFSQAAAFSLLGEDVEAAIRTTHIAATFLLRVDEHEKALRALDDLVTRAESELERPEVRLAMYELAGVTQRAPATGPWATLLARIRLGLERAGDRLIANTTACRLGVILVRMGAYEDGLEILVEVLPELSRTGLKSADGTVSSLPEVSLALLWKGRALDLCGREREAEQAYRTHPAWSRGEESEKSEVTARLAELLIENNRLQEALDLLEAADPADARYRALKLAFTSLVYILLNRPGPSEAAAAEARSALAQPPAEEPGTSPFQRSAAQGIQSFQKVFELDEIDWRIRLILAERAGVSRQADDEERSAVREGLAWARRCGERAMEIRWLRLAGEIALQQLEEALEQELASGDREWRRLRADQSAGLPDELRSEQVRRRRLEAGVGMETLLAIGRAKAQAGLDPLPAWEPVIAAAQRRNRRLTLYHALTAKARCLGSEGRLDVARILWENAVDVLESLRAELRDVELQSGVLEDKEAAYGDLLLATVEAGDAEGAMRLMERAKARALLEEMSVEEYRVPLSPELEERARHLRQTLVRAMGKQMQSPAGKAGSLERLKDQLASVYRAGSGRVDVQRLAGARGADVARLSAGGKAVLHYFVSEEHVIVAAARDGRLVAPVRLDCRKLELIQLLETFQFEISTRERCHSLAELYSALIEPVAAVIDGVERAILIPHGILHAAPMHALRGPDARYLMEKATIQYAPSVAVALRAGGRSGAKPAGGAVLVAVHATPYCPLPRLDAAGSEVEAVAGAIPGASVLQGTDAVRRHVLRLKGNVGVLHMACHGEFDNDDPLLSRLYLADGPLYGYEIERLACRPQVVVLSACETGVQRRKAGDETFGLVRAFLSCGAEAVVASLWKVADESTAILMRALHRELFKNPTNVAGALRKAQQELLSSPKYSHPFWWAPYLVTGGLGLAEARANA